MFIARRHPMMKNMLRAESGVFGTYALAVVAVVCSVVSATLFLDPTVSSEAAVAAAFGDAGPPEWMQAAPQRSPGTEQSAAAKAAPAEAGIGINGLDLPAEYPMHRRFEDQPVQYDAQPVYDEAGAISIYTR